MKNDFPDLVMQGLTALQSLNISLAKLEALENNPRLRKIVMLEAQRHALDLRTASKKIVSKLRRAA